MLPGRAWILRMRDFDNRPIVGYTPVQSCAGIRSPDTGEYTRLPGTGAARKKNSISWRSTRERPRPGPSYSTSPGIIIGMKQIPFDQIYPQPGWVEHDPEEIWKTQYDAAEGAIEAAQVEPDQIAAIGITNQRETTILWDRATGKPVYNAIVWQCRRSSRHLPGDASRSAGRRGAGTNGARARPLFFRHEAHVAVRLRYPVCARAPNAAS